MGVVTTSHQTRLAVVNVDGKTQYKITATVTDAGQLPSMKLFLVQINDTTDPKADTFGRVAGLFDFDNFGEDRAAAVLAKEEFWRIETWDFYYDDLATAVNAQDVLKTRIDELVTTWETYTNQFVATDEIIEHPRTGLDAFNTLVEAYTNAAEAEATALAATEEANTAYQESLTAAATAASNVTTAQTNYNDCVTAKSYFDACLAAFTTLCTKADLFDGPSTQAGLFLSNSKTFKAAADALRTACTSDPPNAGQKAAYDAAASLYGGSQLPAFESELHTFQNDVIVATAAKDQAVINQSLFAGFCVNRQTALTDAQTAKATADETVANARTAYESAQAAYLSAQAATEAALAAVRALKPTWTPTDALPGRST